MINETETYGVLQFGKWQEAFSTRTTETSVFHFEAEPDC